MFNSKAVSARLARQYASGTSASSERGPNHSLVSAHGVGRSLCWPLTVLAAHGVGGRFYPAGFISVERAARDVRRGLPNRRLID